MKRYTYLIVGAGAAAASAASAIRKQDPQGSLLMLGAESDPPYQRPLYPKVYGWVKTKRKRLP